MSYLLVELLASLWHEAAEAGHKRWLSGGLGEVSTIESALKSARINVLIIAIKVNIQRVTGPEVPVNLSPANSKAKFDPVTMSSDRTIVKAITDAKATAPNTAKLGCIGEFHHILTPIIKDIPAKIQANTIKRNNRRKMLTSGLR